MIKLLISVKNAHEAKLAMESGADLIDLKDPAIGALGNISDELTRDILLTTKGQKIVSATVGEGHDHSQQLLTMIDHKFSMGVDIVKLSLSPLFENADFIAKLQERIQRHHFKLVAVMFADEPLDFSWIEKLANLGFYGVMLDIAHKNNNLLLCLPDSTIHEFVKLCETQHLQSGLAGALRVEYVPRLVSYLPSYIGFRSGVCEQNIRQHDLLPDLVKNVKEQLYKNNNTNFKLESMA